MDVVVVVIVLPGSSESWLASVMCMVTISFEYSEFSLNNVVPSHGVS